jgi:hypothetical protein
MQQLEIKYFFPLTEQIPLDLDYKLCEPPKIYYDNQTETNTQSRYNETNQIHQY